jgi:hypothetical protein
MLCHKDMTFCLRECGNMDCARNLDNIPLREDGSYDTIFPVAMSGFGDCEKWKEG